MKRDIASAEHYVWGGGCDGWVLSAGSDLLVIQERMPPGTSERRHYHARARQFFYVLEGELAIDLEGVVHRLPERSGLEIPPGAIHKVQNLGQADAHFLVTSSPSTRGDRVDLDD